MTKKSMNQNASLLASINWPFSIGLYTRSFERTISNLSPFYKQFALPLLFIGIGSLGVLFNAVHVYVDMNIRNWILSIGVSHTLLADYLQHAPVAAVYILGACGIKGKHNLRDKTLILLLSYIVSTILVHSLKSLSGVLRPDGSAFNAFPSGHTTTAFMSAEFLWMEYKDKLNLPSRLGYLTAASTGLLRIYTNRHWLTDVIAGTGFGLLSTRLSYLLFAWTKQHWQTISIKKRNQPERNKIINATKQRSLARNFSFFAQPFK